MGGKKPNIVSKSNPFTMYNIKRYLRLKGRNDLKLISTTYENAQAKLWWICNRCKSKFDCDWNHIQGGRSCPYCHGKRVNHTNSLASLNPKLASEWHPTKNGELTPRDVTCNSNKEVWWKCSKGHEYKKYVSARHSQKVGCNICSMSSGEQRIRDYLEINNIEYIYEKKYSDLIGVGGKQLSYDFYLPKYKLLIEFQGEYHDGNGNYHMKQNLETQKEHDFRKKRYAIYGNTDLLEIWYWDFDNIEMILEKELLEIDCQLKETNEMFI